MKAGKDITVRLCERCGLIYSASGTVCDECGEPLSPPAAKKDAQKTLRRIAKENARRQKKQGFGYSPEEARKVRSAATMVNALGVLPPRKF